MTNTTYNNKEAARPARRRVNALVITSLLVFSGLIGYITAETHAFVAYEANCPNCSSLM